MYAIHSLYLLALFVLAQTTLAVPLDRPPHHHVERDISEIDNRALLATLSQSVSFNTVTTTQTQSGVITQSCQVTLTPITNRNGQQVVRQDRVCRIEVNGNNNGNNGGNGNGNNENTTTSTEFSTSTSSSFTSIATTTSLSTTETLNTFTGTATAPVNTGTPAISVIGTGQVPATGTAGSSVALSTTLTNGAAATTAPPAISVIGVNSLPATGGTAVEANGATGTLPVTVVTTLSDGSVSTTVTTPSAAAAQAEAASVPGRKLEVLPIGLGVFAGISVIALIVVGLVTYERTKYRKAFRQRKLAEAGANMGYGGMAERT